MILRCDIPVVCRLQCRNKYVGPSHIVLISTSEEQPDDGHLKAETCSCQYQSNFAIQLNICCVYDGPTYLFQQTMN